MGDGMANTASDAKVALPKMRGLIMGFAISQAIAAAGKLGIADLLRNGPRTVSELSRECGVAEHRLYRLLRALSGEGVFAEQEDGRFELTPAAELLRSDHPESLRDWAIFMTGLPYRMYSEILHSVKTGEDASRRVFGAPLFEYVSAHPDEAAKLHRAMVSVSAPRVAGLLEEYDFSRVKTVVDVGGGSGAMVAAVAKRYPGLHGVSLDLANAEPGARKTFNESGLLDRCEFIAQDFFQEVPAGADVYILSAVLHDWGDEQCLKILHNCRRAIPITGTLLIVDLLMSGEKNKPDTYRNFLDVTTLLGTEHGGMERTENEFRKLLESAGFRLARVIQMKAPQAIIEALPQ
jgi:ubiquinone/menaquinone biosynthesis C-methylase UbiE